MAVNRAVLGKTWEASEEQIIQHSTSCSIKGGGLCYFIFLMLDHQLFLILVTGHQGQH